MTALAGKGAGLIRGDAVRIPLRSGSVNLGICSPPYFALRSYQDDGEHYDGQIGSEAGPIDFLCALWAVADEMHRVLDDGASWWINLGDKYAGSGGHNNSAISSKSTLKHDGRKNPVEHHKESTATCRPAPPRTGEFGTRRHNTQAPRSTRRTAPDRYSQAADVRAKSLMGLPWRFAMGLICPDLYRAPFEPAACWHDDGPGPCRTCPPRRFPQWIGRAEVIWSKPNGLPESVTDRVRRSHEQWFHVTKAPTYFAGIDEVRERQVVSVGGRDTRPARSSNGGTNHRALRNDRDQYNPLGKLPGSVWTIPSEPLVVPAHLGVDHFAAFPQEWPRRIIAGWSPTGICTACGEGRRPVVDRQAVKSPVHAAGSIMGNRNGGPDERGWDGLPRFNREHTITGYACACPDTTTPTRPAVVLDPFNGTGTVPMVARALGRYGIGIDLSRDYLRLANWRIWQSGHARKTEARTNRERQGDLFGGAA